MKSDGLSKRSLREFYIKVIKSEHGKKSSIENQVKHKKCFTGDVFFKWLFDYCEAM